MGTTRQSHWKNKHRIKKELGFEEALFAEQLAEEVLLIYNESKKNE